MSWQCVFCQVPASKIVMLFSAGCAASFPQDGHPCGSPAACVLFWLVYLVMRAFRLRWLSPWKRMIRPWRTVRSMRAAAMSGSPNTRPHPPDSMSVV